MRAERLLALTFPQTPPISSIVISTITPRLVVALHVYYIANTSMFNHLADGLPTWWDICDLVIVTDTLDASRLQRRQVPLSHIELVPIKTSRSFIAFWMIEVTEHKLDTYDSNQTIIICGE